MRMRPAISPLLLVLGILASCNSTPLHLYTLAPATAAFATAKVAPSQTRFVIDEVRIPKSVDRKELIVRKDSSEFEVLENDHWNTPLREEVRQALRVNLELALATEKSDVPTPLASIEVNIVYWEATAQAVYFKAEWRLRQVHAATTVEVRCDSAFTERTLGTPEDLVRADRSLIQALAQPMARTLRMSSLEGCGG